MSLMTDEIKSLKHKWADRNIAMKKWYNLVRLENDLHQEGMESVISPDPRTSYNMALWLLKPKKWSVAFDSTGFTDDEVRDLTGLEKKIQRELLWQDRRGERLLFGAPMTHMLRLFITTGWLAFAHFPDTPHWTFQALHPANVYPEYDYSGRLVKLARTYTIYRNSGLQYIVNNGWSIPSGFGVNEKIEMQSLWVDNGVEVYHGVSARGGMNARDVRPMTPTGLDGIPIYCLPGGGLPDDGSIANTNWCAEVGQALVASIMDLQKNLNKMSTYMQQILRDTANTPIVTRTREGVGPVTPENRFKRGGIWDIHSPDEDIFLLNPPAIQADMRSHMIDMRQSEQRALFPDVSFGSFSQTVSTYLMSQATAGTQQVLDPFYTRFKSALGNMITYNVDVGRRGSEEVLGYKTGKLPEELLAEFIYDITVPGDFIQRANSARIVNPNFRISEQTLIEELFPEIQNAAEEQSRISVEDAANSELFQIVSQIKQYRVAAADAAAFDDYELEQDLVRAIELLRTKLGNAQGNPPGIGAPMASLRDLVEASA